MILPLPPSDVFVPPPPSSSLLRQISSLHLSSAYIRPPVAAPPRLLPPSPPRMCLSLHAALSRSPRPLFCPALHDLISLPPPGQKGDDPDRIAPPPGQKGGRWMNTSPLRDRRATIQLAWPPLRDRRATIQLGLVSLAAVGFRGRDFGSRGLVFVGSRSSGGLPQEP